MTPKDLVFAEKIEVVGKNVTYIFNRTDIKVFKNEFYGWDADLSTTYHGINLLCSKHEQRGEKLKIKITRFKNKKIQKYL